MIKKTQIIQINLPNDNFIDILLSLVNLL